MQVSGGVSCKFDNVEEFMEGQNFKVKQRKEEMKQIQKGIYRTQVMIDSQAMETLMKECEKNDKKNDDKRTENEKEDSEKKDKRIVDVKTEMERMTALSRKLL